MAVVTDPAADPTADPAGGMTGSAGVRRPYRPQTRRERALEWLPRGNLLSDEMWRRRHAILQWFLLLHLPALIAFGFWMGHDPTLILATVAPVAVFRILGGLPTGRRLASFFTTAGIVWCSAALVVLADGAIEAHFHFFIVIGFIALYQDWVPFGWNIAFTVLSHGIGSALEPNMMFNHMAGMDHPWRWSLIHGVAVLAACVGMVLFWRTTEDEQRRTLELTHELGEAELRRRRFASELLVSLARRNQSLLYRQLDIINQLEHAERDPDALAGLFRLDHLATRIRRNAENLLVLSGEEPPRVWGKPVPLSDVVRAAIAETEDLKRVSFVVDERLALLGQAVVDVTHLLAELIENAVRSSPPDSQVTIRTTPDVRSPGTVMLTVEDWGVGMPPEQLTEANQVLATPGRVEALTSNRLGLHVIARLASRYGIQVVLTTTSGVGITAVVLMPPELFTATDRPRGSSTGPFATQGSPPPRPAVPPRPVVPPSVSVSVSDLPPALPSGPGAPADGRRPPSSGPPNDGAPPPLPRREPTPHPEYRRRPDEGRPPTSRPPTAPTRPVPGIPSASMPTPPAGFGAGPWAGTPSPAPVTPAAGTPVPAAPPAPAPPAPAATDDPAVTGPLRLARRQPQSHLAPGLRRDRRPGAPAPAAPATATPPDAARAREALSRYQASRRAALAGHDESQERT